MRCPDPEKAVGTTYERAGNPLCELPNPRATDAGIG